MRCKVMAAAVAKYLRFHKGAPVSWFLGSRLKTLRFKTASFGIWGKTCLKCMSRGPAVLVPGPLLINNETEVVDKVFCKQLHPKRVIPLVKLQRCKCQNLAWLWAWAPGYSLYSAVSQPESSGKVSPFLLSFLPLSFHFSDFIYVCGGGGLIDLCLAR